MAALSPTLTGIKMIFTLGFSLLMDPTVQEVEKYFSVCVFVVDGIFHLIVFLFKPAIRPWVWRVETSKILR